MRMDAVRVHAKRVFLLTTFVAIAIVYAFNAASAADDEVSSTTPGAITFSEADTSSTSTLPTEPITLEPQQSASTTDGVSMNPSMDVSDSSAATSTARATTLKCSYAYTAPLYATRSGHQEPRAAVIGSQSWTVCEDENGHSFEFKMTPEEYNDLALPGHRMPYKYASTTTSTPVQAINDAGATASQESVSATPINTENDSETSLINTGDSTTTITIDPLQNGGSSTSTITTP